MPPQEPDGCDDLVDLFVDETAKNGDRLGESARNWRHGGWSTAPFIIGSALASTTAMYGVTTDLIPFLDRRFNIKDIKASEITNIINSLMNLTPIAGAVLCDSYLGCFLTISIFTFISFLGTLMLMFTALIPSMAPPSCDHTLGSPCQPPSTTQFAALCFAFAITTLGAGGTSFTYVAFGANQLDKPKDHEVFVNWFFFTTTLAMLVSFTVVVYIMDDLGWDWGYGLCAVLNAISLALFVLGKWWYRDLRPEGSPFAGLARVWISAVRKAKLNLSQNGDDYYNGENSNGDAQPLLTSSFSFLNKAALITKGDVDLDGSIAKPWRLCSTQEVEDLKTLLKVLPLWSTGIFLSMATGIQTNLTVMQSLAMNRTLGPHFKIPAASYQVFAFISMAAVLPIIDRFFYPFSRTVIRRPATVLHRIGAGHIVNILGFVAMGFVESMRLQVLRSSGRVSQPGGAIVPMSALWLVPPLVLIGAGSAFYIPGQVSLYYQEFPASLKNTGTAMMSLTMGIGFYLSTLVVAAVKRCTDWLADDINDGHVDNVFWVLAVLQGLNLFYYLMCAKMYKLQHR